MFHMELSPRVQLTEIAMSLDILSPSLHSFINNPELIRMYGPIQQMGYSHFHY